MSTDLEFFHRTKSREILNTFCIKFLLSLETEYDISTNKFKMGNHYLRKFSSKNVYYEEFTKYFNLIVNIYLNGELTFGFTDSDKFQDFKQKITQLTYMTLVEK